MMETEVFRGDRTIGNDIQKSSCDDNMMYRLICENSLSAYIFISYKDNRIVTLGRWKNFFDFDLEKMEDLNKLFEAMDDETRLNLMDNFFIEKFVKETAAVECRKKDTKVWLNFQIRVRYDANLNPTEKIICIDNITRIKTQSDELMYMAYYDPITGLFNRNYFIAQLDGMIRKADNEGCIIALMLMDIDEFKKINDTQGMVVGDEVIQQFGSYLRDFSNDEIMVCHMGGDMYCLAIYNPIGMRSVESTHKMIMRRLQAPFKLSNGENILINVSVGVAEFPDAARNALELINCAEIVLFKGKALGKNAIQYFDEDVLKEFKEAVEMENKLRKAVFNSNFVLYYQPQYFTGTKKLRGMEALVRWKDEEEGMISPTVFIPIAEKNGAIIPIGNWVVEEGIRQYAEWSKKFDYPFTMSINISALQCDKPDFVSGIVSMADKFGVSPGNIELEVTESVLINDFEIVSMKLKELREHGFRISLDDFGTGFSSLSYLKRLPIDVLKIDKSFIDTILTDSATQVITESIIRMVKTLGYESIAEGVENEAQFEYLKSAGCDIIQGFLLGKPQPASEIEKILNRSLNP